MTTTTGEDPEQPLPALSRLAEQRRALEREESELVRRARAQGLTWQHIAGALGVTKQAVHKKHGRR